MRILLTNDDGIRAPGLWALHAALAELGAVTVIAPSREQSGIGLAMWHAEMTSDRSGQPMHGAEPGIWKGEPRRSAGEHHHPACFPVARL